MAKAPLATLSRQSAGSMTSTAKVYEVKPPL